MTSTSPQAQGSEMGMKERFFRYFQYEITALQEQMANLHEIPPVGGERADAIDHCVAGIAHLSNEVQSAAFYLPAHDQRTYVEAIKALTEKLQETRAALQPRTRFTFKRKAAGQRPCGMSVTDAAAGPAAHDQTSNSPVSPSSRAARPPSPHRQIRPSSVSGPSAGCVATPSNDDGGSSGNAKSTFSSSSSSFISSSSANRPCSPVPEASTAHATLVVRHQSKAKIVMPFNPCPPTSGSLTNICRSMIDISVYSISGSPLQTLALQGVCESVVVCGGVSGPVYMSSMSRCVVVVAGRQCRMHECNDCTVYLFCASRPIIEDCRGISFAPLPGIFRQHVPVDLVARDNRWQQVDDFKWLKTQHSPHWRALGEDERVRDEVWARIVRMESDGDKSSVDEALKVVSRSFEEKAK